ncbi:MAG: phosphate signaling complex protein PhoU [Gemmatimonadota bacterium]
MTSDRARRHFHEELDSLQNRLLEMAGLTEEVLRVAVDALIQRNLEMADRVIAADDAIDRLELELDEKALELLALQQPMAVDLRRIISTLKISNDLERVGDHAVKIGHATRRLADHPPLPVLPEVEEMARHAMVMLADALAAYVKRDPVLARAVRDRDARVNALRRSTHRLLISHMLEDPRRITPALELLIVAQSLERVGDLATNMAEELVFLVEGQTIKHH